jgi:hypothetical protein
MTRALWMGTFGAIACLAVAMGSGLYLLGNTGSGEIPSVPVSNAANIDEQAPKEAVPAPASGSPGTSEDHNAGESAKAGAGQKADYGAKETAASKPTAVADKGEAAKDAQERRQLLLEALGALTASHGYQTYLNIGLIADGKAKGTYTEKDAYRLLDSVLALLSAVDRKLAALDRIDLDKEDRANLEQTRQLSGLLRKQAQRLQTFWDTGKDEDAAQYESARKDSWAALSRLTGIGR